MSNVFTYPNNADTNFISDDGSILIGALDRATTFLSSTNDEATPYAKAYYNGVQRFAGLSPRTSELLLQTISGYRTYYGVATGDGINGYPSYKSVFKNELIEAHFFQIQFRSTDAQPNPTTGTLTIDCRRDSTSHPTVTIAATDTHGMGDAGFNYTTAYPRFFQLSGFDTSVAGEWGNYLNNNTYYLKVINASQVEVYTDADHLVPVNIGPTGLNWSSYTSGGLCKIESQITGDITTTTTFDPLTVPKGFGDSEKSVAISGDYIAVTARKEISTIDEVGQVYVFDSSTGTQLYAFDSPLPLPILYTNGLPHQSFGSSISISGDYLIVGCAVNQQHGFPVYGDGHVYVYDLTTGNLLYTYVGTTVTGQTGSMFGTDVAANGNYMIIGAPRADVTATTIQGKAYVYDLTTGNLVYTLVNPDPDASGGNDQFGQSVTITSTYAIVGSPNADVAGGLGNNDGQTFVFSMSTGILATTLSMSVSNTAQFGQIVAADGNTLVVGGLSKFHYYNMTTLPFSGIADIGFFSLLDTLDCDGIYAVADNLVYELSQYNATLIRTLTGPFGTTIGDASAINGDTIVCASESSDRVFVFQRSTGNYLFECIPQPRSITTTEFGYIGPQPYTFQLISAVVKDQGNRKKMHYVKDYTSGYTNLNTSIDEFGEYINGARAQFYCLKGQSSSDGYASNSPIDNNTVAEWWYDSDYNPDLDIITENDGNPSRNGGGWVNGVTFDPVFAGLMATGGSDSEPYRYGALAAIKTQNKDSDLTANYSYFVSNITNASPGVVTFNRSSKMTVRYR